jgi:hypothetical protein
VRICRTRRGCALRLVIHLDVYVGKPLKWFRRKSFVVSRRHINLMCNARSARKSRVPDLAGWQFETDARDVLKNIPSTLLRSGAQCPTDGAGVPL